MTMYRYVTLMWNRTDRDAAKAADYVADELHKVSPHAWRKAWNTHGIAVFDSGEHKGRMQTYRLHDDGGAVLGRLFHNDYTSVIEDLNATESRACLKTKGQHLIDNYWGRYVAFLHDRGSGTSYVMRDPSGVFPCFHTPFRGVEIYFSDMQDAANLDFLDFTVNWDYLKTNIILPQFQKTHTGLNEVGEVLPAECVEITPFERKSQFVWDPTEISQTDVVEDPEEAAALLRSTVKNTIGAVAGCYDRILLNLGGFDSSIALACIAEAPHRPEITCATNFTASPQGEERLYSRQVANKFGTQLLEWELDYRKADLSKIFRSNKLASPPYYCDSIKLTGDVLALTQEKETQALFTGNGGDNVFFQYPNNLGALDYVSRHGFGKEVLKVSMEASRYGGRSLSETFGEMLQERFSPAPCYSRTHDAFFAGFKIPFVNPEFIGTDSYKHFLHPLLIPDDRSPKGKHLHILGSVFFHLDYYDRWDSTYFAEQVHVFMTQPIIEMCLRIPVWVLTYGGIDRGLARKAFQEDLPRDIVMRRSKSTPSAYFKDLYEHNIGFLREVLLDGVMVREKILTRDKLEAALNKEDLFLHIQHNRIFGYLATEVWLRGWMERSATKNEYKKVAI